MKKDLGTCGTVKGLRFMSLESQKEKEGESKKVLKEIMAENFSNLARARNLQIQEVKKLPNPKRVTLHKQPSGN